MSDIFAKYNIDPMPMAWAMTHPEQVEIDATTEEPEGDESASETVVSSSDE